jgi:hypothetical protein
MIGLSIFVTEETGDVGLEFAVAPNANNILALSCEMSRTLADNLGHFDGNTFPCGVLANAVRWVRPIQLGRMQMREPSCVERFNQFCDDSELLESLVEPLEERRVLFHDA